MRSTLEAVGAAILLLASVQWLRFAEQRQARAGAGTYLLHFPRDTDPQCVVRFLAGLTGLRPAWYRRWLYVPTIVFEVRAVQGRIEHAIVIPRAATGVVLSQLRAALPSVRLDPPVVDQLPSVSRATVLELTTTERPLRTDHLDAVAASVLTSVQPLQADERIVVQWLVQPSATPRPVRLRPQRRDRTPLDVPRLDDYELLEHSEALRARRTKHVEPLFRCLGRIGVEAATTSRAHSLIERVSGSYQQLSAPGVDLRERHGSTPVIARQLAQRLVPIRPWPRLTLNAAEVVAVVGWPVGLTVLPHLVLGGCRQLPPATVIPKVGCVIGESTFAGSERPVAIAPADRLLHAVAVGPTGVGKSTLLTSLITQDMNAGRGVVVVDAKGDLVRDCLDRVPQNRIKDVVVLDPSDTQRPIGLNLLAAEPSTQELVADHVVHVFHELFSRWWGPRTDDVFRAALLTLMRVPNMTLLEVPKLLTNKDFRRRFVDLVRDDDIGLGPFWATYEALRPADQAQVISPLMNKLRQCVTRSNIRFCVGQATPTFQLDEALRSGALVFVPLQAGVLGEDTAALMGSLVISRLWQTIQGRSAVAEAERRPVHLYVDEAQKFIHLPTSLGDVLAQARGLKLGVTLALQHLGQLEPEMRQDLLANCRSKVIFQTSAKDGHTFAQELRPYLTAEDLQGLGRFEIVAQLAAGQQVAPPVTARTLPAPLTTGAAAEAVARSTQRYGVDRAVVEAEIRERQQTTSPAAAAPIGRQRKRPA
jgi:hypothetical protein